MVVYQALHGGADSSSESDPCVSTEIVAPEFGGLTDSVWALPGLEPPFGTTDEKLQETVSAPLILVGYSSRDALFELASSIEGVPGETPLRGAVADPHAESSEREFRAGPWLEKVASRFVQLLTLPYDWDGHGAGPVSSASILAAGSFLATVMAPLTPAPTVVPTSSGGLQLEWHCAGLDVELMFGEEDLPLLFVAEVGSGREWEGPPVEGFAEFELAQRLSE